MGEVPAACARSAPNAAGARTRQITIPLFSAIAAMRRIERQKRAAASRERMILPFQGYRVLVNAMILVDAECFITAERRVDFVREVRKIIPVVLREDGCTRYELVLGISGESYHFLEQWASRKHLDDHIARPHMQEYFHKTDPWHSAPTKMTIYEIASAETVTM